MSTAASFCRKCGIPLTEEEKLKPGNIYCTNCAPVTPPVVESPAATVASLPVPPAYATRNDTGISPGLAFLLGLIPGVGAIYNGQYAKGLIHVVIFGMLVSMAASDAEVMRQIGPLVVMLAMAWVPYMAFEAYHTARRRMQGEVIDEFSSLVPLHQRGFPAGPVLLIAFGVLFLLNNLDVIHFAQLIRYWPIFLIALGVYMLWVRLTDRTGEPAPRFEQEIGHD